MISVKERIILTICFCTLVISLVVFHYGCRTTNTSEAEVAPQMERGIGISITPEHAPNNDRAIQMLSTRITDLEARVSKLENPVRPLPEYPTPRN